MVIVGPGPDPGTVRKEAGTAGEQDRLAHEAEVLAAAPHPGVVELVAVEHRGPGRGVGALVLRTVGAGSLAGVGGLPASEVGALGAAVVTVLADLHDIGVIHGDVTAAHVLLDDDGRRPVLCSLGRGTCPGQPDGPTPADDVAAAGALLAGLLSPGVGPSTPLVRALARATDPRPSRRPSARRLAGVLTELAGATPRPAPAAGRTVGSAAAPAVPAWPLGTGSDAVADSGVPASRTDRRPRRTWRPRPLVLAGAVIDARRRRARDGIDVCQVGLPGRRRQVPLPSSIGRRHRDGSGPLPSRRPGRPSRTRPLAVHPGPSAGIAPNGDGRDLDIRPMGRAGRTVTGRLVANVGGASSLRVAASSSMCDRLIVLRHRGRPLTLDVPPSP